MIEYPKTFSSFRNDPQTGNPAGGTTQATGLKIDWQNGTVVKEEPNGAFVETVIEAAEARLNYYQASKFNCSENRDALRYLALAKEALLSRAAKRVAQGVEGMHVTHESEKKVHSDHEQNYGA